MISMQLWRLHPVPIKNIHIQISTCSNLLHVQPNWNTYIISTSQDIIPSSSGGQIVQVGWTTWPMWNCDLATKFKGNPWGSNDLVYLSIVHDILPTPALWLNPLSILSNAEDEPKDSKEERKHTREPLIKNPVVLPEFLKQSQIVPADKPASGNGDLAVAQAALRKELEQVGLLLLFLVWFSCIPQNHLKMDKNNPLKA